MLDPSCPDTRRAAVTAAQRPVPDAVLAALARQVTHPAQQTALDALAHGVAVVTGQQAGLFGGPLYTLHKVACAVRTAQALQEETGVPCAAVFWLQDEDHDFEEIRHATLVDRAGERVVASLPNDPAQDGRSVAARQHGDTQPALQVAAEALGNLPFADDLLALCRSAYTPTASPAQAMVALMQAAFAHHGVLILDPADPALRDAARPVHDRAFAHAPSLAAALQQHATTLQAHDQRVPVHIRPDAPLSFVHPDGPDGPRFRVRPDGPDHYVLIGCTDPATGAERREARSTVHGWHASTSALLRPILQDTWLPTAAYVGGPGERAYLAQMVPLWPAFDLPQPLIVARSRFALVDDKAAKLLDQLGLTLPEVERPRRDLLIQLAEAAQTGDRPDPDTLLQQLTQQADAALTALAPHADQLDAGFAKSVAKAHTHLHHNAQKLVDRYRKALTVADDVVTARLDRLLDRVQPGGVPQERVLCLLPFAAQIGLPALVDALLAAVVPFDSTLREVRL